ncbi:NAD(P)/FAD-dependent oxidoreductase [Paenibacillus sp. J5C_2022]|uniref:NAD(P)/FAD-dependent oxidoreductase n=1 Tax=Paenibacillus sp. J5C2022 TaxID=2977129 RepID=UPI0021CF938F|nr:NAD(P)/FAD-dependent oxidoreductase [Paenibacillus sp. J5C2022]MCU6711732.1 NAD(P)/FAD-dependent oxidoreductase [Paenibacillus sp. J5C2022]
MRTDYDALVLGAGVAGSSMAAMLAAQGWSTALMDRQRFPKHKVCGEFLSPESRLMLSAMGLTEKVESLEPHVISRISLFLARGGPIELPLPGTAIGVSRHRLDAALQRHAAAEGALLLQGGTVTAVIPYEHGYIVHVRQGGEVIEVTARIVVAAWGAGGQGRLFGRYDNQVEGGGRRKQRSVLAHERSSVGVKSHFVWPRSTDSPGDAVELYFFPGGYLGINGIECGRCNVAALLDREDIPRSHTTVEGMLKEAASRNAALQRRMRDAQLVQGTEAAVAPVRIGKHPAPWRNIPHIGDAIGRIPPLCGDGMSMGLRSAQLCAAYAHRYLAGEWTYEQWRMAYTRAISSQFSGPLRWGKAVEGMLRHPAASRLLPGLAKLAPRLACKFVEATRLRISSLSE